ncbi:MAG TPA: hypothetical protein VGG62_14865 [Terracidiphilus sp.]|jgi:hypothetical protein
MIYTESAALMTDPEFRSRIKVAALEIANYYLVEDAATPSHNSRYKWGQLCYQSPDAVAGQLQHPTVMDSQVQTDGAAITDAALHDAVERVVNKVI